VVRGPIMRRFGLATLVVYTAGTQNHEIPLEGLTLEVAERLRRSLLPTSPALVQLESQSQPPIASRPLELAQPTLACLPAATEGAGGAIASQPMHATADLDSVPENRP
jgi:Bacterial PH domain